MRAGIEITDGIGVNRGTEAARLLPRHAVCATVDWPMAPGDGEETILPGVVAALSDALVACGNVAFRYDDPLDGAKIFQPPPPRSIKNRLLEIIGLGDHVPGVVVAAESDMIAPMFADNGWSYGVQAMLVFDPAADPSPILDALRAGLDWRERTLPAGTRFLFGPGHDGYFAVIAAVDPAWIERFKAALD